jgi:hypothetical protein
MKGIPYAPAGRRRVVQPAHGCPSCHTDPSDPEADLLDQNPGAGSGPGSDGPPTTGPSDLEMGWV